MNRWHFAFLALLVCGGAWLWLSRVPVTAQSGQHAPQPAIGYPAPDFTLKTLDGKTVSLRDYHGTPVVLNFWATWCGPCQEEMPAMQATAARYVDKAQVLGVDLGEKATAVQPYVDELKIAYPILLDTDQTVAHRYNVTGMPTTFFIDADGVIRHMWMGGMNRITLAEGVTKILR